MEEHQDSNDDGFFSRMRKRRSRKLDRRTVIKIKTVGDIPPVVSARRHLGNGDLTNAVIEGYNSAKSDYIREFNVEVSKSLTNRQFLIEEFNKLGISIPEDGNLDNGTIVDNMGRNVFTSDGDKNRVDALRKLATFYLEYYERVRFSGPISDDPSTVMEKLEDIYNYLDIMSLYYAELQGDQEEVTDE